MPSCEKPAKPFAHLDQPTARALTDAGYMRLADYRQIAEAAGWPLTRADERKVEVTAAPMQFQAPLRAYAISNA